MSQIHHFQQSLEISHSYSDAKWWEQVYRQAFPNFVSMADLRKDGWWQRAGIDRVITLSNSKQILVDEKVRTSEYDDILLERWSDRDRKTAGWIQKDLACDYIAYAFVKSKRCYFLPFLFLRKAWKTCGRHWVEKYKTIIADNKTYKTESVAVPIDELMDVIQMSMLVRWD